MRKAVRFVKEIKIFALKAIVPKHNIIFSLIFFDQKDILEIPC